MFQDLHVIDFHAHFPIRGDITEGGHRTREPAQGTVGAERDAARRAQLRRYQEQWRLAWDFPEPEREPRSTEEQAARWAAEVERHGLDRVVFVTGRDNDELARAVALHPDKFVGLAHHDITRPDAAAELERAATQLGLRGYKMLAPTIDMPLHDRALYPVWEVCERLGLPVLIHFGMLGGAGGVSYHPNITPAVLEPVARDFPHGRLRRPPLRHPVRHRPPLPLLVLPQFMSIPPARISGSAGCPTNSPWTTSSSASSRPSAPSASSSAPIRAGSRAASPSATCKTNSASAASWASPTSSCN
ncbi:MAG: amidohydrolase family protein [Thermomicrobiales bacterium]